MKGAKQQLLTLIAEINDELTNLSILGEAIVGITVELEKSGGEEKEYLVESAALKLHNLYSLFERIFEKFASEINGGSPTSQDWHMRLLRRMSLEVDDVRPRVIDEETYRVLLIYLKFRHVVRSIYGFEIDPERLMPLLNQAPCAISIFTRDIRNFIKFLKAMANA